MQPSVLALETSWHAAQLLQSALLLPAPPHTWRRRIACQLKTWATMIKAGLESYSGPRVYGNARWRKDWVKVSSELAQDRRAWSASV